jgi:hypothetical protein
MVFIRPNCSGIFQGMSANRLELAPFPVSRAMAGMPHKRTSQLYNQHFLENVQNQT